MKLKTILKKAIISIFIAALFIYSGCGEDSTTNNNGTTGGGYHPTITFAPGQSFTYTTDTLYPSGTVVRKRWKSVDVVQPQSSIGGQLGYYVAGATYDTTNFPIIITIPEVYAVRYDQNEGKYYQYGLQNLINPLQAPSWDVVANFEAARGTSYNIATIYDTIPVPGYGNVVFTGPLTGKVDSTTIQTTAIPPVTIPCYHVEMLGDVSGPVSGITLSAKIYIDYYISFQTPVGLVELKSRPFNVTITGGTTVLQQGGYDRKLKTHTP